MFLTYAFYKLLYSITYFHYFLICPVPQRIILDTFLIVFLKICSIPAQMRRYKADNSSPFQQSAFRDRPVQ